MSEPKYTFNTKPGQAIERHLYLCCGNSGTEAAPEWGRIGRGVEDSSAEMNWNEETKQDVLGITRNKMKKPVISQTFDPCELDSEDKYQQYLWNLAVVDQDAPALCNQDLLRIHLYSQDGQGNVFAERYHSCMVKPTGLGGPGGGALQMPIDVTFGGKRDVGTASVAEDGTITFTPKSAGGNV